MCCDALETEAVTAVRDERILEHAHTYRTSEVILSKSEHS